MIWKLEAMAKKFPCDNCTFFLILLCGQSMMYNCTAINPARKPALVCFGKNYQFVWFILLENHCKLTL